MSRTFLVGRAAAIVAAGVLLLWGSLALSVYFVSMAASPAVARAWWPSGAEAQARAGEQLTLGATPERFANEARTLAAGALMREPVNVRAARVLAVSRSLSGDDRAALGLFRYAERLSRRDIPTQLALIESSVQAGKIDDALVHYDRAMRTSANSVELLVPVLSAAADDPEIARPLGATIARRPLWWPYLFDSYLPKAKNPQSLAMLVAALRFDPAKPAELSYLTRGMMRLVELDAYPLAERLYLSRRERPRSDTGLVQDGTFDREVRLTPFEWSLSEDEGRMGVREQRVDALGTSLALDGNIAGVVARQILSLKTGRYGLVATVGSVASEASPPQLTITCADGSGTVVQLPFPATEGPRKMGAGFTFAPTDKCRTQWLSVELGASLDRPLATPWIDNIVLRPLP